MLSVGCLPALARKAREQAGWTLIALALTATPGPAHAGHVWWKARDGSTTGSCENASWNDLQTAITNAQAGSAATGLVKISGDITRTNATWGQLTVSAGGVVAISGGWNWPGSGAEPTTQNGRSKLDAAWGVLGTLARVFDVNAASNVFLGNIEVTGGRSGGSGAGIFIHANAQQVTLTNLYIHDNTYANPGYLDGGGGIAILSSVGVLVSHCDIVTNTTAGGSRGDGGGFWLNGAGNASAPVIVEHSLIQGNLGDGQPGFDPGGGALFMESGTVLLANCRIIGNRTGNAGSAVYKRGGNLTLWGCLVAENRKTDGSATTTFDVNTALTPGSFTLANCTVIQPADDPSFRAYDSNAPIYVTLINSIVRLIRFSLSASLQSGYYSGWTHAQLKSCTFDVPTFRYMDGPKDAGHWHETNTLSGAVTMQDDQGRYRFHSLTAANADANPSPALDLQEAPQFAATNGFSPYQLLGTDHSVDTAVGSVSGSFQYVDVNLNGAYNALVDVIVAGTPPGGDHFIYMTDLIGNKRLKARDLDRGCYEYQPPKGTVVMFK